MSESPTTASPVELSNVVDGADRATAATLPFWDPATGAQIGHAPDSSPAEVEAALAAAKRAFRTWKRATPADRASRLLRLADLVEQHQDQLLEAELATTGKPRELTRQIEILRGADQLRFFAGAARVLNGIPQGDYVEGFSSTVRREPKGVIAQITPWNYPFMMAIWKIGPALAAGNTLVIKPADTTPWSTVLLGRLAQEVYPPGVVNVVCGGRETGAALVASPLVDMVSITGSTRAGSQVMAAAAQNLTDVHLELGGKAPAIVLDDVDIPVTADGVANGSFFNAGQDCTAITRVLVHEHIHDSFVDALVDAAAAKRAAGPNDPKADLGPLNSAAHLARVEAVIAGLPPHAEVRTGGRRGPAGYLFEPTVITGVRQDDDVVQQETFGPVITVQAFASEEEALELANGTPYALASSVWGKDHGAVTRIANELDFGTVWINCHQVLPAEVPHGGFKHSGVGKDLSVYGFEDYTRLKAITSAH